MKAAAEPRVAIVVPRRAHPHRDELWRALRPKWATLPWPLIESAHEGEELFNRALCVNAGAAIADQELGRWDVLLVIDSDVYVPHAQIYAAVEKAHETDYMTVAFRERHAIAEGPTAAIVRGELPVRFWADARLETHCEIPHDRVRGRRFRCRVSNHDSNSHCVALPRGLWDEMEGFDERFEGWGFEDMAVLVAQKTFRGEPNRIEGKAFHLWHPRAQEREWGHPHYGVNEAGGHRYFDAEGDPKKLKALIAEKAKGVPLVPEEDRGEIHETAAEKKRKRVAAKTIPGHEPAAATK